MHCKFSSRKIINAIDMSFALCLEREREFKRERERETEVERIILL